jgi:hypothetical protein
VESMSEEGGYLLQGFVETSTPYVGVLNLLVCSKCCLIQWAYAEVPGCRPLSP